MSSTYRSRLCVIAIADTLRRNSAVSVPYSLLTPVELAQSPVSELQTLASAFVGPDGVRQSSSGILFPFSDGFAHLRCDEKPRNKQGDPCKYLTPVGCKFSLKVFGDGEPVIATEGWKDAFRIHLETGKTTVALPSVSAYGIIPPSVQEIVYDADAAHNPYVRACWFALASSTGRHASASSLVKLQVTKAVHASSSAVVAIGGKFRSISPMRCCVRSTKDGHQISGLISFAAISAS